MKVVIPAAGLGIRFLPATKAQPKEMLPVVDKPAIQYVVEEAVASGMTDLIIITGRGKRAIEDHFDRSYELEHKLRDSGNTEALEEVQRIASMADIFYIRQKEQLGLGHAILCAKKHVGNEPFAVMLGDDIVINDHPCIGQLAEVQEEMGSSVVGVESVPKSKISRYGVIDGKKVRKGLYKVRDLIEKPSPEEAPSDLAIIGRYVFEPEIFTYLEKIGPGKDGEYQLTDAMKLLCRKKGLYGLKFAGRRFDIGSKADWIRAIVELSSERKDISSELGFTIHKKNR
ncbi:MAG: UTP--glucose-1-phosphate uridylyltransferase GalU [Thermoplasmata archaeon]|nr:UTP--glucose-1-phosphate uridylyltransferase GalU [Thermoplasmata archaeon]MCJ7561461.1 UTP--glucose-1-phosphate uridylyltransferase GalU [Thermoplasmata archaeon]TFG68575.1 MAG: UTP--glucose-1-phosphate uridylyltransferase GalU [Methanomassiliicoccus sp.]